MKRPVRLLRPLPLLALLIAAPLAAQRHNAGAPIDFAAQRIELQDRANRAILSGGVSIQQGDLALRAARVTVTYTGEILDSSPQVSRLDAAGGVIVTRPGQRATAQYAVYDLNRRVITMLGDVTLTQDSNTVRGGRLSINLDTGRAVIDGANVGGGGAEAEGGVTRRSGRVTGRFSVPDRD